WFESADVALTPSPEAFASAMLIPALAAGKTLTIHEPLSPVWLSNVTRILPIFSEWWGYPQTLPLPVRAESDSVARKAATAVCFTGGVDSFYSLLRSGHSINYLVFARGFDIPVEDQVRFDAFEPSLRQVAVAVSARPIVIRSNLREHPAFALV